MTVTVASGTSWPDIMTAFRTVGAVVVAVGIALWTEWRSGRKLKGELGRSDRLFAEEREHNRAQIEEEHRVARERDQLAEAYAVQVVPAEVRIRLGAEQEADGRRLAVIIVNRGSFTITRIHADRGAVLPGRDEPDHAPCVQAGDGSRERPGKRAERLGPV